MLDEAYRQLVLDEKQLARLQAGEIIVDDGVSYSLLVPLVVPRASIPDLLGVIMLGKRLKGAGYSTPILKNLQALVADAGKAIYLSDINAEFKSKVVA